MIFQLFPDDDGGNHYLLGHNERQKRHVLHSEYRGLVCENCGKVNERAAIQMRPLITHGLINLKKEKRDFVDTCDGFYLASDNFIEIISSNCLSGISFQALPELPQFSLITCKGVVIDESFAALEYHGPYGRGPYRQDALRQEDSHHRCVVCDRVYEHCRQPRLSSMQIEGDDSDFFTPAFRFEKQWGEQQLIFVKERAVKALEGKGIKGLDFFKAY